MSLLGTGRTPQAGSSAEAEALIAEARARARRRRLGIAVAVLCAAAVAAGGLAAGGAFSGPRAAAPGGGAVGAVSKPPGPPGYFVDTTNNGGYTSPEIRAADSGAAVAQVPIGNVPALRGYDPPYDLAATGPSSFVLGMMTPSDCSTQLFRFQLSDRGRPGALTQVGPTLPGTVSSIAASAGGGLIAYAIDGSGCANARHLGNYLGVLDPSTGRTRLWTNLPADLSPVSISADGRLIAFAQTMTRPAPGGGDGFQITGYQVRVLATDAAPGTVDARSRVAAPITTQDSLFAAPTVLLSPTGTSFYLCAEPFAFPKPGARRITDQATIVGYLTATGKATGVIAAWAASYPPTDSGSAPLALSCSSMALDPSGQFLLVPYLHSSLNPADEDSGGSLTAARVNIRTGAKSDWTLRYGEREDPGTMTIAW